MQSEAVTRELTNDELRSILLQIIKIGNDTDSSATITLLYGFAWGNTFNDWQPIPCTWDQIVPSIAAVEAASHGSLGSDDLYITINGDEFHFCHHSDIHYPIEPVSTIGSVICTIIRTMSSNKPLSTDASSGRS